MPVGVVDRASANDPAWHPRYHIWWSERSIPSLPDGLPKWCVGARCREITLHHAVGSINSNLTPKPWSKLLNYFACHSGWSAMWLLHAVGRHCAGSLPCCHRMIDVGGLSCNGPLNLYHALTARLLGVMRVFSGPQAARRRGRPPYEHRSRDPARVLHVQVSVAGHVRAVQGGCLNPPARSAR